jgi:hypothetical protein
MRATLTDGIWFVEGSPSGFQAITRIDSEIGDLFTSAQLKSLRDLKELMAVHARSAGGNCIAEFKYGQRSSGFWRSLITRDDLLWYGTGVIGTISEADVENLKVG